MKRFGSLAWLCVMLAIAVPAAAQSFHVMSVQQANPGHVVATVAIGGRGALKASDVALRLDGAEVLAEKVDAGAQGAVPARLVLCIDQSGSMGPAALNDIKAAFAGLWRASAPELPYSVSVTSFGSRVTPSVGFSNRTAQLSPAIAKLRLESHAESKTRLFDAIGAALDALRDQGVAVKRILVISDGKDEGSALTADELRKRALSSSVPIDAIAIGTSAAQTSGSLSNVAGAAGGRFVAARGLTDLSEALQQMTQGLGPATSYTMDFRYTPAPSKAVIESPSLIYKPDGSQASTIALGLAVAAPASQAPASEQTPAKLDEKAQPERSWISIYLNVLVRFFKNIPPVVAWIGVALLGLAVVLLLLKRRPQPAPPPVVVIDSPPPPTFVNPPPKPPAAPRPPRRPDTVVGHVWSAPRPGRPTAILRGVSGSSRGAEFPIDKALVRIGCDPDNDLILVGDDFASGSHALIRAEADGLYVEDLNSLNGSFLNNQPFKGRTRALAPNDEVRFGRTTFVVLAGRSVAAPAPGRPGGSGYEPSPR